MPISIVRTSPSILLIFAATLWGQDNGTNWGGTEEFKLSPGQQPVRTLFVQAPDTNDPLSVTDTPADIYTLVNLTAGHSYKLSINKVDGYSGFAVLDKISGNGSPLFNVTTFSEVITSSTTSYGPIEVWLAAGATSALPFGLGYASTSYQISLIDANTPSVIIQPAAGIHDGMLIKSVNPSDATVYLIENGLKRGFPSAYHFNSWYFGRWDLVTPVADFAITNTPTGSLMPFKDGALVKYSDRPSDATVFLIQQGTRRGFPSWASFIYYGHAARDIVGVPGAILDTVPRGADMPNAGAPSAPTSAPTASMQLSFVPPNIYLTNLTGCSSGQGYAFTFVVSESQGVGITANTLNIDGSTGWTPSGFAQHINGRSNAQFSLYWCRTAGTSKWSVTATDDNGHTVTAAATLTMN